MKPITCKEVGHAVHPEKDECQRCGEIEMTNKDDALMPCPFCGSKNIDCWIPNDPGFPNLWRARCMLCSGQTSYAECKQDAIDVWNRRADLPAPPVRGDEIENALQWFEKIAAKYTGLGMLSARMQPAILRRALLQPQPGVQWRPIETCPDGTRVMTITPIAMSDNKFFEPEVAYRNGDYWFHEPGFRLHLKPSHWMPLPAPPAATSEQDKGDVS